MQVIEIKRALRDMINSLNKSYGFFNRHSASCEPAQYTYYIASEGQTHGTDKYGSLKPSEFLTTSPHSTDTQLPASQTYVFDCDWNMQERKWLCIVYRLYGTSIPNNSTNSNDVVCDIYTQMIPASYIKQVADGTVRTPWLMCSYFNPTAYGGRIGAGIYEPDSNTRHLLSFTKKIKIDATIDGDHCSRFTISGHNDNVQYGTYVNGSVFDNRTACIYKVLIM